MTAAELSRDEQLRREMKAEKAAMRQWTTFILCLLFGGVGMWIYAAYRAVNDETMAIVPDYHEKALKWDEHLAIQQASNRLQWTTHLLVSPDRDAEGKRTITLFLRDAQAQPVAKAEGQVRLYHHARGKSTQTVDFKEIEPGTYEGKASIDRNGSWQFEISLQREGDRFEKSFVQEIEVVAQTP